MSDAERAAEASEASRSTWPVWGHDAVKESLRHDVGTGRVRHAYAFSGPEGIGKTTLAAALARALLCDSPPTPGLACLECLPCRKITRGVHPDVQTFSLATQAEASEKAGGKNTSLTIETVRTIAASTAFRPMEGRWRVLIVEDAETLQEVAQEALLKTLEEPPSFVVLLLLVNDAETLLPTIRSRCQVVELRPVGGGAIMHGLALAGVADDRAAEIAGLAAGRPGWAIRAVAEPQLIEERRATVERALTWIDGSSFDRLVMAVRLGDGFTKRRAETYETLETLLGVWRDLLLLRASLPDYLSHRGQGERLQELARGWPLADLHRAVRSVQRCIADLEVNVRPRLAMEAMVLQWPINHHR
ncbi:MAG: ATP-binding protein [Thermomicrobiales bacterium]